MDQIVTLDEITPPGTHVIGQRLVIKGVEMCLPKVIFSILFLSSTVSLGSAASAEPITFQCLGSNGLFLEQNRTGAAFSLKGDELTVNLGSSEGQLLAFIEGKQIPDLESATLKVPFRHCSTEKVEGQFGTKFRALWCYRSEDVQRRITTDSPNPPLKVIVTKKDGTKVTFENLNYKLTLTHARINDTASYSNQNSIELNVSTKSAFEKRVSDGESFVIFKGNNMECF